MTESNSKLWDIPDLTEQNAPEDGRKNALNMPLRWTYEPPEEDGDELGQEEEIKPLTAAALDAIREAAHLEGFEEGKLEGVAAGHQEGFEAGYADGEKLGREAAEKAALEATQQLNESLSNHWQALYEGLRHPMKQVDQAVENQLVHLSMSLAKAVCWQEVTQNDDIVREAFKRGIQELSMTSQRVEIYLHPEDIALIDSRWDEKTRADKGWFLYHDNTISRGGCRIQTPLVAIDATLEARMDEVFLHLVQGLKEVPADKLQTIIESEPKPEPESESTATAQTEPEQSEPAATKNVNDEEADDTSHPD